MNKNIYFHRHHGVSMFLKKGLSMAEEIELAQEEQEIENNEVQHESTETQEVTENVETQEGEETEEALKKANEKVEKLKEVLKTRSAQLTKQKYHKDEVIKEQERLLDTYEAKFGKLKEVDEDALDEHSKIVHTIKKEFAQEQLQDYKSNLDIAKNANVIETFNSGVELFSEVYPDYRDEMAKIEPMLDKGTITYIINQGKGLVGQQIAYYLAKNPDELELFKNFDAEERKIELLNIKKKILKGEVKFTESKKETKPQIKATPKASAQGIPHKDISQMTGAEYRAWKANGGLKNLR